MMHEIDHIASFIDDGTYLLLIILAFTAFFKREYVGKVYGLLIATIVFNGIVRMVYFFMIPRFLGHTHEVKVYIGICVLGMIFITCVKLSVVFLAGVIYKKVRGAYVGRLLACLGLAAFFVLASGFLMVLNYSRPGHQTIMQTVQEKYELLYHQEDI